MTLQSLATARTHELADLVARYDGRAPRYTSYPTALQFSSDVDEATYRDWLGALSPTEPVSLYLHVPFCARLCWFCGCNTRAMNQRKPIGDYVQLPLPSQGAAPATDDPVEDPSATETGSPEELPTAP